LSARELLDLEAEALFTYAPNRRLLKVNEPWDGTAAAPRVFLGRTVDGNLLCRYRHDLSGALVDALETLARDEVPAVEIEETPRHAEEYLRLLPGVCCSLVVLDSGLIPLYRGIVITGPHSSQTAERFPEEGSGKARGTAAGD
jgi:hypothetical protein